jgi:hypothetical protein
LKYEAERFISDVIKNNIYLNCLYLPVMLFTQQDCFNRNGFVLAGKSASNQKAASKYRVSLTSWSDILGKVVVSIKEQKKVLKIRKMTTELALKERGHLYKNKGKDADVRDKTDFSI